jgi:hypothetical protein
MTGRATDRAEFVFSFLCALVMLIGEINGD